MTRKSGQNDWKLNICMVLWGNFPPDIRVKREAKYLVDRGHSVDLYCSYIGEEDETEEIDGIQVHRIPSRTTNPFRQLAFHVTLLDPIWYRTLRKAFKTNNFDLIHVHDLPPLRTVILADRSGIPVVADLHELYRIPSFSISGE